jgi:FMN reductase
MINSFNAKPYILGIGGTTRSGSTSEKALQFTLNVVKSMGATVKLIAGGDLDLPMYSPHEKHRSDKAAYFVDQMKICDGLIISSPSYHGSLSGMIKNALDYVEDLREESRVYLDSIPVGLIGCGAGWQGATQAVIHLRGIVHALRAWPTPMGAVLNSSLPVFNELGQILDPAVSSQLNLVGNQVFSFAMMKLDSIQKSSLKVV